ncbi:MAG: RDD family protein [Elusimicrobiota bacterium]|nr:RDD family protein [Elusimicrobiota bacterium]
MKDNEAALPEPPAAEPSRPGFWVRGGALLIDMMILSLALLLPFYGLGYLVYFAYKTIFTANGGQTPGKMAAGIKVVTLAGEPVGYGRALGRALSEWLSAILVALGYVIAAFSDKRALHDYVAGTRVVYVDGVGAGRKAVFAFLGVLAVVVPLSTVGALGALGIGGFGKFKALSVRSGEGATKGGLGSLRSASAIYYGDMEGRYPASLEALIDPRYIEAMPKTKLADHKETDVWTAYGAEVCGAKKEYGHEIDATKLKDTGGWGYAADPGSDCWGQIFVDCTHEDTKGTPWPEY